MTDDIGDVGLAPRRAGRRSTAQDIAGANLMIVDFHVDEQVASERAAEQWRVVASAASLADSSPKPHLLVRDGVIAGERAGFAWRIR